MTFDLTQLTQHLQHFQDFPFEDAPWFCQPLPNAPIQIYDVVPSTNALVWQQIEEGAPEGTVAIALQQTAGKGQRGRQWQSAPGGLYLSMAIAPHIAATEAMQLTLMSAWGIATVLHRYGVPVQIKWLNDLVIHGRKLGGILAETRIRQGQVAHAVIGVGLNWCNPVPDPGITLRSALPQVPPESPWAIASLEAVAAIVIRGIVGGYTYWRAAGIAALIPQYEALLYNMGHPVEVAHGVCTIVGITETGGLRVKRSSGQEIQIPPGEIQLGYA
ncbi:biotin--[acetyl-CoA-carboxylase] ligase [Leptolyngbya sp. AN02str]|uniref:biotin--[acetyl-CoA-carboxylase] ligase n=1 Tax=Leptolyngbya sp. AN02str TaxID=3423363 RepID=UPI003D31DA4E